MRPFIFINVAASADGKISNDKKVQIRISCPEDLKRVDKLRAESDAIMIGIGTVLSDDPKLTIKNPELKKERKKKGLDENPIRVIVDSKCRLPANSKVLNNDAKTIVAVSKIANQTRIESIRKKAKVVIFGENKVNLKDLASYLYSIGIKKLMVEGGATLNYGLLKEKLVDEMYIYYGNLIIGGAKAPTVVNGLSFDFPIKLDLISVERIGSGILTKWRVLY